MDLEELVRAAQRGEPLALAALLRALAPQVGRICGAIALDDGDDAMQETMIRVLKGIRRLREPAALHGWVRRIAVREALKLARTRSTLVPVERLREPPADIAPELRVEVADTLRQLAPEQRAILLLRELEGFTEAEAAALLDIQVGTAKSRLQRARQAFRRRWQG
jgi:RNA polymerase sigma factor (sigma-70 family)